MTTSTVALCSHNSSSSSRLLVSVCFVYLEKSGHELQNGLCVALRLSSSGLCTPTMLVTSDRFPPSTQEKKFITASKPLTWPKKNVPHPPYPNPPLL